MPRTNRPSRVDANQAEIVAAFRAAGATVLHLHSIGHGCPDLLVGYQGRNLLVEVKTADGKLDGEKIIAETEKKRAQLADAIKAAFVPVTHVIAITPVKD